MVTAVHCVKQSQTTNPSRQNSPFGPMGFKAQPCSGEMCRLNVHEPSSGTSSVDLAVRNTQGQDVQSSEQGAEVTSDTVPTTRQRER